MTEELTLKTYKKPSYFNKSFAIGSLAGFCALPFGQMWGVPGMLSLLGAGMIGGSIGSVIEKNQEEKELKFGKKIKKPTFWNKDMLLGGLIGYIGGSIIESTFPTYGLITVLCATGGAIADGNARKAEMEHEYQQALNERNMLRGNSPVKDKNIEIAQGKDSEQGKNFQEALATERLQKESEQQFRYKRMPQM